MLPFCEPGDAYTTPWVGSGFSRCFLETVGSIASAGLLFILGLSVIALGGKSKYGRLNIPLSIVSILEIIVSVMFAVTYAVDLVVKGVIHATGDEIYGYTIVVDGLGITSWIFSGVLAFKERHQIVLKRSHHT